MSNSPDKGDPHRWQLGTYRSVGRYNVELPLHDNAPGIVDENNREVVTKANYYIIEERRGIEISWSRSLQERKITLFATAYNLFLFVRQFLQGG